MCTGGVANEKEKKIVELEGGAKFLVNVADFGPLAGLGQISLLLHGTL